MVSKATKQRAAREKAAAENRRAREKRARRLIIIGAIIFISTYIMKEVFRDELKEFRDSLAAAQSSVETGDAEEMIAEREIAANIRLRQLQYALIDPRQADVLTKGNLQEDLADLESVYAQLESAVSRVSDLEEHLPRWVKNRDKARAEMQDALQKAKTAKDDTIARTKSFDPDIKKRLFVLLGIAQVQIYAINVTLWEDSIMKTAKVYKRLSDWLIGLCTWGALALTVCGVFLAVRGKLAGYGEINYEGG